MTELKFISFMLVIAAEVLLTQGQLPPRLNIPGALLLPQSRPPNRPQRIQQQDFPVPARIRKPIPNALPISIPIREEIEEENRPSILDDEVAKLTLAAKQFSGDDESDQPRPLQFRPERPVPVLRQDLREAPPSPPPRPLFRQDVEDELPQPIRQPPPPVRHRAPPPQPIRQPTRPIPRPAPQQILDDDEGGRIRNRKPPVQILKKYRTDNEDGSITWGFENEDGTFKEETIGADCVIRGKYGYIDPEGTRREYSYETGNKCDQPEEEYAQEELPRQPVVANRPVAGQLKKQYKVPLPIQA